MIVVMGAIGFAFLAVRRLSALCRITPGAVISPLITTTPPTTWGRPWRRATMSVASTPFCRHTTAVSWPSIGPIPRAAASTS